MVFLLLTLSKFHAFPLLTLNKQIMAGEILKIPEPNFSAKSWKPCVALFLSNRFLKSIASFHIF